MKKKKKGYFEWNGTEYLKRLCKDKQLLYKINQSQLNDRTLIQMALKFISIVESDGKVTLTTISDKFNRIGLGMCKSRMRRIYDIAKILSGIGLIECSHSSKKITMIEWNGFESVIARIQELPRISSERKLTEDSCSDSCLITLEKLEKLRRRSSSIDLTIFSEIVKSGTSLIVPKVFNERPSSKNKSYPL